MEYTQIQCQTSDHILTLTLNRPEKLNAFTSIMCKEIVDALVRADKDDDIKAIIVTGAGRAFCSGLDLSPESGNAAWLIDTSTTQDVEADRDPVGVITMTIYDMITPVIAAINGPAIGAGITMTLSMDIRLASENTVIGFPFTRRGLTNEGASSWFLPRLVGMGKAMEWIITGRMIPAGEALSHGLINELVAPDNLRMRASTIAHDIVQNTSPVAVALCRQLLWKMHSAEHPIEAHKIDSKTLLWSFDQRDLKEGIDAFMEKRPPHFPMKPGQDMPAFYPWWEKRRFTE